jgi:hypothetical protein
MIYSYLTAIGQPPGGSSSLHIYTQTIQKTTQDKQYIEQHKIHRTNKNYEECWAVRRLCGFYPGIYLTNEVKARKTLSQGSHT